jgi:hypothetical protein
MSFFVSSDCPACETECPCPDPVQLSPEKIEQEKNRQKKRFLEVYTQAVPANQDAPTKVVSIRVKRELWDEMCQRSKVLGLKTQEAFEIALKFYLFIPIEDELTARKEGEDAFYNSLRDPEPKRSKDLQV